MTKSFKLEFTEAELNYLGNLLADRPYKEVIQLLNNINMQIQNQNEQGEQVAKDNA